MMEIVLDDADMAEAEPVGLLGEVERFLEILFGRFLLGPHIGKELHAELHRATPPPRRQIRPKSIEVRTPQFVFPGLGPGTHERLLVDGRAKPGQDAAGVVRFDRITL